MLAAIRACTLWRSASDDAVAGLAATATTEEVQRGERLVTEGDAADRLGVLIAGKARVYHLAADGRKIVFETVDASGALGAVAALAGTRYPASIDSATPASIAWLRRDDVFAMLEAEPRVARDMVTDLAGRLAGFTAVATTLSLDVTNRLARFLFQRSLEVGTPSAQGLVVDLGMPKSELAASLGTVPETLSRSFARLRDEGLIEVRSREVVVLDVGALARMGEGYEEG